METGQKGALTPEQIAQLQNSGTFNEGVAATPGVAQPPVVPAPAAPTPRQTTPRINPIRPVKPKSVPVVETQEVQKKATTSSDKSYNGKTYFFFEGVKRENEPDSDAMEMDLVTFRERGTETRYLSVSIYGTEVVADANKVPDRQYTSLIIETKEEFEKLKEFISNLNWDD